MSDVADRLRAILRTQTDAAFYDANVMLRLSFAREILAALDSPASDAVGEPIDSRPGTPSAHDSSALSSSLPLSTPPEKTAPAEPCSDFSAPTSSSPSQITVEHCAQAFAGIAEVVTEMRAMLDLPWAGKADQIREWADRLARLIGPKP